MRFETVRTQCHQPVINTLRAVIETLVHDDPYITESHNEMSIKFEWIQSLLCCHWTSLLNY